MKKIFTLLLCIATLASNFAIAATVTIGSGTMNSNEMPIRVTNKYALNQYIILSSQMTDDNTGTKAASGNITSIQLRFRNYMGTYPAEERTWVIYMSNTTYSTLASAKTDKVSTANCVYNNTITLPATTTWYTITLETPFEWNNSKNILLTINDITGTSIQSEYTTHYYFSNSGDRGRYATSNSAAFEPTSGSITASSESRLPQIIFTIEEPSSGPEAPANVTASSITRSSATITWDAVEGADSYEIRYGTTAGSLGDATDVGNVTSYTISGLESSTTYYYQVRTIDGEDKSAWTTEAHFTTTAHTHNDITFDKWNFSTPPTAAGNYFLAHDVSVSGNWEPAGSMNICLNGKTINLGEYYGDIDDGITVAIYDDENTGSITSSNSTQTLLADNATLAIHGGTITNTGGGRAIRAINHADASIDTSIDIADNTDNSSILAEYDAINLNVNLTRSWVADGYYSTLCLPFNLSSSEVSSLFGAGTELATLASSSLDGDIINLVFESASSIQAGKPYLIKPANNAVNPFFNSVSVANGITDIATDYVDFKGTLSPTYLESDEDILFLGAGNTLGWPLAAGNINGMRAYFHIHDLPAGAPALRHARFIAPDQSMPSALDETTTDKQVRKHMENGQLIIIRDGKRYNALGAEL